MYILTTWALSLSIQFSVDQQFYEKARDVKRLGCAGFVTELSIDASSNVTYEAFDEADSYFQVWTNPL